MSDTDDRAEQLDEDMIDGAYPPEQPLGAGEGLTPLDEELGETVRERSAREEPEHRRPRAGDGSVGPLVDGADELGVDAEDQEVALELRDDEDLWPSVQDLEEVQPAEEAAMHLTEPPPLHDDDGYLE